MTNRFAQMWIIFSPNATVPQKCLGKIILIVPALALFIFLFIKCNEIPFRKVNIEVETNGPQATEVSLLVGLGANTQLRQAVDSSIWSPFLLSGGTGVGFQATLLHGAEDTQKWQKYHGPCEIISQLQEQYHDDPQLDSLNAAVHLSWEINSGIHAPKHTFHIIKKDQKDEFGYWIKSAETKKDGHFTGDDWYLTKAPVTDATFFHYIRNYSSNFNLWSLSDISQAYVAVRLSGMKKVVPEEAGTGWYGCGWSTLTYHETDEFSLMIDFGSPISTSGMSPEPDAFGMNFISYTDPKKIRAILQDGLVFHVKFLQTENLQSMKLFWLTTVITALVTWMASIIIKWVRYSRRKRFILKNRNQHLS